MTFHRVMGSPRRKREKRRTKMELVLITAVLADTLVSGSDSSHAHEATEHKKG